MDAVSKKLIHSQPAVPLKTVCREDCKGLCPSCGSNLNVESCDCQPVPDARWSALKDLKDKLRSQ